VHLRPPSPTKAAAKAVTTVQAFMTWPDVTAGILAAIDTPATTVDKLHQLVSQDPSLVTRMLTVVNSALFGLPGKVDSIERAVVILGLRGVKNLAIAAGLGQVFRGAGAV